MSDSIKWDDKAKEKYDLMLSKMPIFHREVTKRVVDEISVVNAKNRNSDVVEEVDIVKAFLTEVPKAFYSLMIRLFEDTGFDYKEIERELESN